MYNHSGFSFIEVLLSLSLISSSFLLLMNQHETTHQLFYQLYHQTMQMFQQENQLEQDVSKHIFSSVRIE